jgi:hypothetical protein
MPGMMKAKKPMKPMSYQTGGAVFKPCAACPNPTKCKAMGKCMLKAKK